MAEVESVSKTSIEVKVDFWHTAVGITVKRVAWQVLAAGGIIIFQALTLPDVVWHEVLVAARVQVAYVLLSTFQTVNDKQIPNTTDDTMKVEK